MLTAIRRRLEQEKGKYQQTRDSLSRSQGELAVLLQGRLDAERAGLVLQHVVQATQDRLTYHLSNPVTAALSAVFDDPYEFVVEFVQRRGKTEVDFFFSQGGNRISADPDDSTGGGVTDIVAFALRVALFGLGRRVGRKTRPVLLLDEPVKFLHGSVNHSRVSELLKAVSDEVGLQLIVITGEEDSDEIVARADRVFYISKVGGKSRVEVVDREGGG